MCRHHLASFVTEIAALSAVEARRRRDKQRDAYLSSSSNTNNKLIHFSSLSLCLSHSLLMLILPGSVPVCVCDRTLLAYLGAQFVTALPISAKSTDSFTQTERDTDTHTLQSKLSLYCNRFSSCSCRMFNNCYSCFFGQQFNR